MEGLLSFLGSVLAILLVCNQGILAIVYPVPKDHESPNWVRIAQDDLQRALLKTPVTSKAKNVILFLGDGLGFTTIWASRIYTGQRKLNVSGEEYSFGFEKFPWTGLSKTYNTNYQVPDSAGTATAFLCGVKANAATVGVNERTKYENCSSVKGNEVSSIIQWSKEKGKWTGIVTTTRITHATPAPGYAHSASRWWEATTPDSNCKDIAAQLIEDNDINVILAGGQKYFLPNTTTRGIRTDGRDLLQLWTSKQNIQRRKFALVQTAAEFQQTDPEKTDYLLGLLAENHLSFEMDRNSSQEPSLKEMTLKAIQILKRNPEGYFLLVEGGRIDHAHHAGCAQRALSETWAFDEAVTAAARATSEQDTLIIVTADHSHAFGTGGYPTRGNDIIGILNEKALTIDRPPLDGVPYFTLGYLNGPGAVINQTRRNVTSDNVLHPDYKIPALVPTNEETHGGEDVPIYSRGPMAHLLAGVHEQHYIAHVMAYASCVGQGQGACDKTDDQPSSGAHTWCSFIMIALSVIVLTTTRVQ